MTGLGTVVGGGGEGRGAVGGFDAKAGGLGGVGGLLELRGLERGEEVGVEEGVGEEAEEGGLGLGGREVFCDVASGVPIEEGDLRAGFQDDGAGEDVAQRGIGSAGVSFTRAFCARASWSSTWKRARASAGGMGGGGRRLNDFGALIFRHGGHGARTRRARRKEGGSAGKAERIRG